MSEGLDRTSTTLGCIESHIIDFSCLCGTVQDQEDFVREQEECLLQEQKERLNKPTYESDQEVREAAGRLEIKGVMLRAMSLELDRFESINQYYITFMPAFMQLVTCSGQCVMDIQEFLRSDIVCRVKFLQRSYHRSRVLKIQKYHQAILSDADELDKLSLPVLRSAPSSSPESS
jgi:hypothetical protein